MTIREATPADIPVMVAMGARFIAASSYRDLVADNPAQRTALGTTLLSGGARSTIFVSERDDRITGMLAMVVYPHVMSGAWTAGEVFWWVDPDVRGDGLRLYHAAEAWAISRGATQLQMIAPTAQLERVYQRLGFAPLERSFQRSLASDLIAPADTPRWPDVRHPEGIQVVDDVLRDPLAYRAAALRGTFDDVPDGGTVFHGINTLPPSDELARFLTVGFPGVEVGLTFLRQSPLGQVEPHVIHSDLSMGAWSAILYLTPDPAPGDGTAFWRRRSDGATGTPAGNVEDYLADGASWIDRPNWAAWAVVPAQFNRVVVFPSRLYHSRARENYGVGDDARLIQVAFGGFV